MNIERTTSDAYARFGQPFATRTASSFKSQAQSGSSAALRPEVVARGRALAADDSYPPFGICEKVAEAWIGSLEQAN